MGDRGAGGQAGVAALLSAAAVAAALIGLQVAAVSSDAGDERQRASVDEVVNSFGVSEAIRFVFQVQVPLAIDIRQAEFLAAALEAEAGQALGADAVVLDADANTQATLAESLAGIDAATLAGDEYRTSDDGLDVGERLADELRSVAIRDPERSARRADDLDRRAIVHAAALVPTGLALGFGSLSQVMASRAGLLRVGWAALAAGVVTALAAGAIG